MKKLSLDDVKIVAEERGGKCLSNKYINNREKLLWKCGLGHQWEAASHSVKDMNHWCPKCSHIKRRKSINDCAVIAKWRGGKCLSSKYINTYTKLQWQCKYGHIWQATLGNIEHLNTWCPKCAPSRRRNTMLKKYGVEHPTQNTEIALKAAKSQNNSCILYHWKTGEELVCIASYENKIVEYLNKNKINFRWQPKTFTMPSGKTYRPDMYLFSIKKWIEIKGYFRDDALEKWKWFQTIKPNSELWNKDKLKNLGIL